MSLLAPLAPAQERVPRVVSEWPGHPRGAIAAVAMSGQRAAVVVEHVGFHLIDLSTPRLPVRTATAETLSDPVALGFVGTHLAVATTNALWSGPEGLEIWDVAHPGRPDRVGGYPVSGAKSLAVVGHHVMLCTSSGLEVIDLKVPSLPRKAGEYKPGGRPNAVVSRGDLTVVSFVGTAGGLPNTTDSRFDVLDTTDPENPIWLGEHRRRLGQIGALALAGPRLYEWDGTTQTSGVLRVFDLTRPEAPTVLGLSSLYAFGAGLIALGPDRAYIASLNSGTVTFDIATPSAPQWLGTLNLSPRWPGASAVAVNGAVALLSWGQRGLVSVDLSTPAAPAILGNLEMGHATRLLRDERHAYLADGHAGIRILDISDLAAPREIARYTNLARVQGLARVGPYLYASGEWSRDRSPDYGFHIIDVGQSAAPREAGRIVVGRSFDDLTVVGTRIYASPWAVYDVADPLLPREITTSRALDVRGRYVVAGTTLYGLNAQGFVVVNIANPASPTVHQTYRTSASGDIGPPNDFAIAGDLAVVVGPRGTRVLRVTRTSAQSIGFGFLPGGGDRVAIDGDFAYVASNDPSTAGIQMLDLRDLGPLSSLPIRLGHLSQATPPAWSSDLSPPSRPFRLRKSVEDLVVSGGQIVAATGDHGLEIATFDLPAQPGIEFRPDRHLEGGTIRTLAQGLLVAGLSPSDGLRIWDVSEPTDPRLRLWNSSKYADIAWAGNHLIASRNSVLDVFDLRDPAKIRLAFATNDAQHLFSPSRIVISGGRAFLADGARGLHSYDLAQLPRLQWLASYQAETEVQHVAGGGNRLALSVGKSRLSDWDLEVVHLETTPVPVRVAQVLTPGKACDAAFSGNLLLVADGHAGLQLVDLSDPSLPRIVGTHRTGGFARSVRVRGHCAFVGDMLTGLHAVDISAPAHPRLLGRNAAPSALMSIELDGDRVLVADLLDRTLVCEGIPRIKSIRRDGDAMVLDWTAFAGTTLQSTTNPGLPTWTEVSGTDGTNSWRWPIHEPHAAFRLRQP